MATRAQVLGWGTSLVLHAAVAVLAMHLVLGEMCIPKARRWGWMLLTLVVWGAGPLAWDQWRLARRA